MSFSLSLLGVQQVEAAATTTTRMESTNEPGNKLPKKLGKSDFKNAKDAIEN